MIESFHYIGNAEGHVVLPNRRNHEFKKYCLSTGKSVYNFR